MTRVKSWGALNNFDHEVLCINHKGIISSLIKQEKKILAFGMGRSYGDVCLNPSGKLLKTNRLDRFIKFNKKTGRLICESGVLLGDIQKHCLPYGWMLPVSPGTQFVTVGGAIANDIHGKNHHVSGSFGNHILKISLARTSGQILICSPKKNRDWFKATIGGIGLTGIIEFAEIQLKKVKGSMLDAEVITFNSLNDFFLLANSSEKNWEYTVSWIDCLYSKGARGVFMRANHSNKKSIKLASRGKISIPINFPFSLINFFTLKIFNIYYYYFNKLKAKKKHVNYDSFFYPLDQIYHWNRIYGKEGFYQYQCVFDSRVGYEAIEAMLNAIRKSGEGSFLAVLKTFGPIKSIGMLSFPKAGVTLALDFPNKHAKTLKLFKELDGLVKKYKGRIYLAKDAHQSQNLFEIGYSNIKEFSRFRDPGISSLMSKRLFGS